jgi:hypothetical protein
MHVLSFSYIQSIQKALKNNVFGSFSSSCLQIPIWENRRKILHYSHLASGAIAAAVCCCCCWLLLAAAAAAAVAAAAPVASSAAVVTAATAAAAVAATSQANPNSR